MQNRYSPDITVIPFGQFFSQDVLTLEIYPLVLKPFAIATSDPFDQVDVAGLSCNLSILKSDGSAVLAAATSFTADATQGILTGILNCNTADMAAYVLTDPTQILIEARFTTSTGSKNVRASGGSTVVRKQYNTTGSPAPLAGVTYLTADEIRALYVLKIGEAGYDNKTWVSDDGSKKILQYLGNDGSMHEDVIP